jgi:hypothetical protein
MVDKSVQELIDSGTVDTRTSLGMAHAIAEAGKRWGELPENERTLETARTIARDEVQKEDMFLDGSKELVAAYNETLINRPDTNLTAFLDDVSKAVDGVDFEKVKRRDLSGLNGKTLSGIKAEIGKSAKKNMNMDGRTVEQDLLHTLKNDAEKTPEEQVFKDVKVKQPQEMGGGFIQMIMMFIGALLGIDMSAMMGMGAQNTEQQLKENQLSFSLSDKEKLNALTAAATNLKDGRGTEQDLKMVAEFAGIKDAGTPDLAGDKMKAFGGQVLGEVDKIREGKIDADTMRADINASYKASVQEPKKETAAAHDNSIIPGIVDGLKDVSTYGLMGAGAMAAIKNLDWDAVAAFAKGSMAKVDDAPHMPGGTDNNQLAAANTPQLQQPEKGKAI